MKNKIYTLTAMIGLLALLTGCVGPIARSVSPRVIRSDINAAVSRNELRREVAETGKVNEQLVQEMTSEWNKVAIAEIRGKSGTADSGNKNTPTIDKNGVLGGFECLFINESPRKKTITAEKVGGFLNGQKFDIPLEKNTQMVLKLPVGYYSYTWIAERSNTTFPVNRSVGFDVTAVPHYCDLKTGKNYHGGAKLFGY